MKEQIILVLCHLDSSRNVLAEYTNNLAFVNNLDIYVALFYRFDIYGGNASLLDLKLLKYKLNHNIYLSSSRSFGDNMVEVVVTFKLALIIIWLFFLS